MKIVLYENVIFRAKKHSSHDELLVESVVDSSVATSSKTYVSPYLGATIKGTEHCGKPILVGKPSKMVIEHITNVMFLVFLI